MTTPTTSRTPRAIPDHWDEHVRLAQWVDEDKPQGIIAYKNGTATSVALSATAYAAFTLTNVPIKANRFYLIVFVMRGWQNAAAGGTANVQILANGALIASTHGFMNANQWYMCLTWHMPYILAADTTVTFVANVYGPAGSTGWFDRGGQLRIEDKGKARGGTIQ